jgi:hypothetical protein
LIAEEQKILRVVWNLLEESMANEKTPLLVTKRDEVVVRIKEYEVDVNGWVWGGIDGVVWR